MYNQASQYLFGSPLIGPLKATIKLGQYCAYLGLENLKKPYMFLNVAADFLTEQEDLHPEGYEKWLGEEVKRARRSDLTFMHYACPDPPDDDNDPAPDIPYRGLTITD